MHSYAYRSRDTIYYYAHRSYPVIYRHSPTTPAVVLYRFTIYPSESPRSEATK